MGKAQSLTEILVRAGEIGVSSDKGTVLTVLGLGSCVSVIAFDSKQFVGGIAHIQLPDSTIARFTKKPNNFAFANIGFPELLTKMRARGVVVKNVSVVLVGGAQLGEEAKDIFQVGRKNQNACKSLAKHFGVRVVEKRLGGTEWRSVRLFIKTGYLSIQTQGKEMELIKLSSHVGDPLKTGQKSLAIKSVKDIRRVLGHLIEPADVVKRNRPKLKNVKEVKEVLSHLTKETRKHSPTIKRRIGERNLAELKNALVKVINIEK